MGGVAAAYLATLALISGRWFKQAGQAPPPVSLAGATLIYAGCGILSSANERFANAVAWGFFAGAVFSPELSTTIKGIGAVYGTPPPAFTQDELNQLSTLTPEQQKAAVAHPNFIGPTIPESQLQNLQHPLQGPALPGSTVYNSQHPFG